MARMNIFLRQRCRCVVQSCRRDAPVLDLDGSILLCIICSELPAIKGYLGAEGLGFSFFFFDVPPLSIGVWTTQLRERHISTLPTACLVLLNS